MTSAAPGGRLSNRRITIQDIVAAAAVTAIAATLSLRSADVSLPLLFARADRVPNVVVAAPALAPRYLDRAALGIQSVAPPQLVRDILWPALGSPARLETSDLQVILARPRPGVSLVLVPRNALTGIDQHLYALPPLRDGARLLEDRIARASGPAPSGGSQFLPALERNKLIALDADMRFQRAWTRALKRAAKDTGRDARAATDAVRQVVADTVRSHSAALVPLAWSSGCTPTGVGSACVAHAAVPPSLPPGLYAIALVQRDELLDVQLNAAYRPRPPAGREPRPFVVAADLQWGDDPAVAGAVLKFVSHMNSLVGTDLEPDFIMLAGDIVDCQFGSAGTIKGKLLGGADDYPRDFLQAWLALAALRIPVYITPGNHDGYRFQDALGRVRSDGLLLFEDTFGPTFQSFDVAGWRFILLNSYDLPDDMRTARRSDRSNVLENASDKLNVLNWGGGIRTQQLVWLRARLGLDGAPRSRLRPVLVMHHDPRGAYPAFQAGRLRLPSWGLRRHVPLTAHAGSASPVELAPTPRSSDTIEIHVGHYTPLRASSSVLRSKEWFDLTLGSNLPPSTGDPGWSRYQQEWHLNAAYGDNWSKLDPLDTRIGLASPADVLKTIVDGQVRVIFKGHDNRFARAAMTAGESILGSSAEEELVELGVDRPMLQPLHLKSPLNVYHVADIADRESDGHGFFWVRPRNDTFDVLELDHF